MLLYESAAHLHLGYIDLAYIVCALSTVQKGHRKLKPRQSGKHGQRYGTATVKRLKRMGLVSWENRQ